MQLIKTLRSIQHLYSNLSYINNTSSLNKGKNRKKLNYVQKNWLHSAHCTSLICMVKRACAFNMLVLIIIGLKIP